MDELAADVRALQDRAVVELSGELDLGTAPRLRDALGPLIDDPSVKLVILDVQRLTFMDSTGLGVIVGAFREMRAQGRDLWLSGPSGVTRRLLEMTGVLGVIPTNE